MRSVTQGSVGLQTTSTAIREQRAFAQRHMRPVIYIRQNAHELARLAEIGSDQACGHEIPCTKSGVP